MLRPTLDDGVAQRLLELGDDPFVFLQIGAFDGKTGDPLCRYVEKFHWHGVLVEPQPRYFAALQKNYASAPNLIFKNVAVSDRRETRYLYTVLGDSVHQSEWAPQMASFDKDYLLREGFRESDLTATVVQCVTLDDLLDEVPHDRLDLLQIDVEAYDYEVLRRFNFERCRPRIVRFEHKHLGRSDHDAAVRLLLDHGYHVAVEPAGDTLACWRG